MKRVAMNPGKYPLTNYLTSLPSSAWRGKTSKLSFERRHYQAELGSERTVALLELDLTPAHFKGLLLHIVFMLIPMLHNHKREEHGAILAKLSEIADADALKPLLDEKHFGLAEVGNAYDRLTSRQAIGKVVVEI